MIILLFGIAGLTCVAVPSQKTPQKNPVTVSPESQNRPPVWAAGWREELVLGVD
jgi:hypothetical protein